MSVHVDTYGRLPSGELVERFRLQSPSGLELAVISYGGIITELHVPDAHGETSDVVLGLPKLEDYLAGHPYFGAITGRVAGRISGGKFSVDGRDYQLPVNEAPNHLHGGEVGLDKRIWDGAAGERPNGETYVRFSYASPEGEEGYPGNVEISVTYTLTPKRELRIETEALTDAPTPLNITNHSYFNLSGESSGSVLDQVIQIFSDHYVPTDKDLTLSGKVTPVDGEACDLRNPVRLGDVIEGLWLSHGDNYMVKRDKAGELVPVARVHDPKSGRTMEVLTTETCLQFYTGVFLDRLEFPGKSGTKYSPHDALCLECHGYPDGVNHPEIDDILLRPEQKYHRTSIYAFS